MAVDIVTPEPFIRWAGTHMTIELTQTVMDPPTLWVRLWPKGNEPGFTFDLPVSVLRELADAADRLAAERRGGAS